LILPPGLCYRNEKEIRNLDLAISFYRKAIDKGDINALVNLANCYKDEPTTKNLPEAVKLYRRAIEKGGL
jgi:TPR repeat protein